MPNWVDNSLSIKGEKNRIAEVRAQLEAKLDEGEFFWRIVRPREDEMADYETVIGTGGKSMSDPTGWYAWNISHWGTKWDASEISVLTTAEDTEAVYTFNTAWSPPIEAIRTLSEQYPDLQLNLRFIEEQGWGGEGEYIAGQESILEEWDIPETHEDSMKYKGYCWCENSDDQEYWYDDCPREEAE